MLDHFSSKKKLTFLLIIFWASHSRFTKSSFLNVFNSITIEKFPIASSKVFNSITTEKFQNGVVHASEFCLGILDFDQETLEFIVSPVLCGRSKLTFLKVFIIGRVCASYKASEHDFLFLLFV